MILQGDFHASSAGKIHRSGELTLQTPVDVILGGTLGTGDLPFPSSFRKMDSKPSELIGMDETLKPTEKWFFDRGRDGGHGHLQDVCMAPSAAIRGDRHPGACAYLRRAEETLVHPNGRH